MYIADLLFFSLITCIPSQSESSHDCVVQDVIYKKESCCTVIENSPKPNEIIIALPVNQSYSNFRSNSLKDPVAQKGNLNLKAQSSSCNLLCNTDFEDDKLVQPGNFGFFNQDRVSCWNTTATDQQIEIWGSGFGGVPAYSGNQFAELNANMVSTLFQNFTAALGSSVEISFAHRGRAGVDVMSVEVGPVTGPFQNLGNFSADRNAWVFHTINYTFPASGSTVYSIRFVSVSAAGGATVGNFLDAISIKLSQPNVSFTISPPNCPNDQNGSCTLHARGGSPPYNYHWMPPINSIDSMVNGLSIGMYQVEVKDFYGCGEILSLNLNSKHENDTIGISRKVCDTYTWPANGQTYTQSGPYVAVLQNSFGCDSLIQLDLEILHRQRVNESIKICDSYIWPVNGKNYTKSGIYTDTLTTSSGCDSIRILHLEVLPNYFQYNKLKTCNEYTWPVNGRRYTQSGIYSDTLTNAFGCDSIITLDLEIRLPNSQNQILKICKAYTWPANNQIYTQSGQYIDTLTNVFGCDSIITLDLEILPAFQKFDTVIECQKYFWAVNGQTYTQSGIYIDTLINTFGCDSIVNLNLKIVPDYYISDTIAFCDSYTWPVNGQTYKQSGNYKANFQNRFGCDSVLNLKLILFSSTLSKQSVSSCTNYMWPANGLSYTKSGIYKMQTVNTQGCDSIIILDLEIHPSYIFEDTLRICDTYTWPRDGNTYTQNGRYKYATQSSFGCDSTYYLQLSVDPNYIFYDTITAVERYVWPVSNTLYENSGVFQEQYQSVEGCDSSRVLFLQIKRKGSVYIPNVFTPNGDGINDKFIIYSSPEINLIDRFLIYDRWGELLFQLSNFPPNDPVFGWDGNYREQKMIPAVFVYTVEWTDLTGEKHFERGDVTLIR